MNNKEYFIPTVTLIKEGGGEHEFLSLEGIIELPSWKDFQRKSEHNVTQKRNDNYKRIRLSIGGDEVLENPVIVQEHVTAYEYILQNQEQIKKNILDALLIEYPSLQEQYGYDEEVAKDLMPNVDSTAKFVNLIEVSSVYLLNVKRDEVAYVGFSFWCTWDNEHGLGAMMHKDRVVEIGGSDTAFLTWIAERDLNTDKENQDIETNSRLPRENYNRTTNKKNKPWWKFW